MSLIHLALSMLAVALVWFIIFSTYLHQSSLRVERPRPGSAPRHYFERLDVNDFQLITRSRGFSTMNGLTMRREATQVRALSVPRLGPSHPGFRYRHRSAQRDSSDSTVQRSTDNIVMNGKPVQTTLENATTERKFVQRTLENGTTNGKPVQKALKNAVMNEKPAQKTEQNAILNEKLNTVNSFTEFDQSSDLLANKTDSVKSIATHYGEVKRVKVEGFHAPVANSVIASTEKRLYAVRPVVKRSSDDGVTAKHNTTSTVALQGHRPRATSTGPPAGQPVPSPSPSSSSSQASLCSKCRCRTALCSCTVALYTRRSRRSQSADKHWPRDADKYWTRDSRYRYNYLPDPYLYRVSLNNLHIKSDLLQSKTSLYS